MSEDQPDLFGWAEAATPSQPAATASVRELSDAALVAAIPRAGLDTYADLVSEAARRRLFAAVPALAALCSRFAGFGRDSVVREQVAALSALAAIGGPEAAAAVAHMLTQDVVQGPGLAAASYAAAQLRARLPVSALAALLAHASPAIRADACRCARDVTALPLLAAHLDDPDRNVRTAAACALGCLGSEIARPALIEILRRAPSVEAIEAVVTIADETCMVLLGRIAREVPRLADAALEALEALGDPRASRIATAARRAVGSTASQ